MNRLDLLVALQNKHIDPRAYSIYDVTDTPKDGQFVFIKEHRKIVVFYLEKGIRNEEQQFIDEDEACRYFFSEITGWPEFRTNK